MARTKETDWQLAEAIRRKKILVNKRFPLIGGKICSSCRDLIVREFVWKTWVEGHGYIYVCCQCSPTWDKAYDRARECCDPNKPSPIVYRDSGY